MIRIENLPMGYRTEVYAVRDINLLGSLETEASKMLTRNNST
jgi:hypothetical protein